MRIRQLVRTAGALAVLAGPAVAVPRNAAAPCPGVFLESSEQADPVKRLNNLARFCAGLDVDRQSELYDLTLTDAWAKFAAGEQARWASFNIQSEKVRAWVRAEVSSRKTANAVEFYPFGGPDILFARLMRPSAKLYVLIGLEPVGSAPDPEAIRRTPLAEFLSQYGMAIEDILQLSFFRREDLAAEMKSPVIDGVLPVFMVLLARTGHEILSVKKGRLNTHGEFVEAANEPGRKPRALRLSFRERKRGDKKTLIYISQDLGDPAFESNRGLLALLDRNLGRCFTFIKSASYLMHKPVFSRIRQTVLAMSDVVLQDDSGIPYRCFERAVWKITLYGGYSGPIELFKDFFQKDLLDAYTAGAKPLSFRIGYSRKSNLLLAVRKSS